MRIYKRRLHAFNTCSPPLFLPNSHLSSPPFLRPSPLFSFVSTFYDLSDATVTTSDDHDLGREPEPNGRAHCAQSRLLPSRRGRCFPRMCICWSSVASIINDDPFNRWNTIYSVFIDTSSLGILHTSGKNFPTLRRLASSPKDLPITIPFTLRTPSSSISSAFSGYFITRMSSVFFVFLAQANLAIQKILYL
jgi:hypothetical protein